MGSIEAANISRFICRLCSQPKSIVIHIYSQQGRALGLHQKVLQLPIKIKKFDKLPKTICLSCINELINQCNLINRLRHTNSLYKKHLEHPIGQCPEGCPFGPESDLTVTLPDNISLVCPDVNARKVDFRHFNPNSNIFVTNRTSETT